MSLVSSRRCQEGVGRLRSVDGPPPTVEQMTVVGAWTKVGTFGVEHPRRVRLTDLMWGQNIPHRHVGEFPTRAMSFSREPERAASHADHEQPPSLLRHAVVSGVQDLPRDFEAQGLEFNKDL